VLLATSHRPFRAYSVRPRRTADRREPVLWLRSQHTARLPGLWKGRIAQRKSTRLTSEWPVVRTHLRPRIFRIRVQTLMGQGGWSALSTNDRVSDSCAIQRVLEVKNMFYMAAW
jgi:hypothetical protein